MTWKWLAAGLLGLALALPSKADPGGDEEFPEGPGAGSDDKETLPDSDEDEMVKEDEVDHLAMLEDIIAKMKDAEQSLGDAGAFKAKDAQGRVIEDADKLLSAKDLQEKAIAEMTRIFGGGTDSQQKAVDEIEKLIKMAKEGS